jgi:pimeloyl-ACP methyl ester carboxylesterase
MSGFVRLPSAVALAAGALLSAGASGIAAEKVSTVAVRDGVTVKFIENTDAGADVPIVILFAGGNGRVNLDRWNGKGHPSGNFLVRTRRHWVSSGFQVVVPDAPSDRPTEGLDFWRTSKEHTGDIAAVIAHIRKSSKAPLFLVGTSRGTISAAAIAAQVPPGTVAGIVLTSSVTRYNRARNKNRVQDAKLDAIRVPVLLVHHEDDACALTPFSDLPRMAKEFTNASSVKIVGYTGGGNYRGDECGPFAAHGYRGIERRVVGDIAQWIRTVATGGKP